MKKETNDKIPKGFIKAMQIYSALGVAEYKKEHWEILYLPKSIYDKRMRLIFDELARFHNDEIDHWELNERIVDIKNGDYDDK